STRSVKNEEKHDITIACTCCIRSVVFGSDSKLRRLEAGGAEMVRIGALDPEPPRRTHYGRRLKAQRGGRCDQGGFRRPAKRGGSQGIGEPDKGRKATAALGRK